MTRKRFNQAKLATNGLSTSNAHQLSFENDDKTDMKDTYKR